MFQGVRDVLKVRNGVLDVFKYLLSLLLMMVVIVMMNMILTIPIVMLMMFSRLVISSTACLIIMMIMSEHDAHDRDNHVLKVGDLFDCRPAINRAFHHCKNVANKGKNKVNKCFFSK